MDKKHRDLLRKNRLLLVEDLEATQLSNFLYQEGGISENDMQTIKAKPTRQAQAEKLLDILPRRGPKVFDVFCRALEQTDGQGHLLDMLKTNGSPASGAVSSSIQDGNRGSISLERSDGTRQIDSEQVTMKSNTSTSSQVKKNALRGSDDDDLVYSMKCEPHGLCLIVNNVDFENLSRRGGSDVDAKKLDELFTKLQYKVKMVRNQTSKQLKETLTQFARLNDHGMADSVVVCLLSHGLEGQIFGVDGVLVSIPDLLALFNGYAAKDLIGKPKMFFIQACRGSDFDRGVEVTDGGYMSANEVPVAEARAAVVQACLPGVKPDIVEPEPEPESLPAEADMLVAYSTVPGYVSWNNLAKGSWFVQAIADVFSDYAHTEDVVSMLIRVNNKVAREFESYDRKKQIPAPVIMLTKKVFFFPS
ncbi:caspase-3-like [Pocillopora verrucosa]|uniref:caspase-3-like n=1 Tax=Pocillopora verrucosa TaxID=203993 RepID=UPI003340B1A6